MAVSGKIQCKLGEGRSAYRETTSQMGGNQNNQIVRGQNTWS